MRNLIIQEKGFLANTKAHQYEKAGAQLH
uniref:Uncharacterized protein n=1 Tax=Rhizophora mucronata TaxID=61149 RepID=A0A2P2QFQ5_RHIMU